MPGEPIENSIPVVSPTNRKVGRPSSARLTVHDGVELEKRADVAVWGHVSCQPVGPDHPVPPIPSLFAFRERAHLRSTSGVPRNGPRKERVTDTNGPALLRS